MPWRSAAGVWEGVWAGYHEGWPPPETGLRWLLNELYWGAGRAAARGTAPERDFGQMVWGDHICPLVSLKPGGTLGERSRRLAREWASYRELIGPSVDARRARSRFAGPLWAAFTRNHPALACYTPGPSVAPVPREDPVCIPSTGSSAG